MPLEPNAVVLEGLRLGRRRDAAGAIATYEVTEPEPTWVVAVPAAGAHRADLAGPVEVAQRFALGAPGVAAPRAAALTSGPRGSVVVVAYAAPRGRSLAELTALQALDAPGRAEILRRLGAALAHLHDRGVCHGLLRPEWVVPDGDRVALVGFGVDAVLLAAGATLEGALSTFSAPELQTTPSDAPGPAADVYALAKIIEAQLASAVVAPSERLSTLLQAALAASARERPKNIAALAEEAARVLEVGHAPQASDSALAPPWASKAMDAPGSSPGPGAGELAPETSPPEDAPAAPKATPPPEDAPAPDIAPPPEAAPAPGVAPPPAQGGASPDTAPPRPPPARPSVPPRGIPWAWLSVLAGGLLLLGGVVALFAFARLREPPLVPSAASSSSVASVPAVPPPATTPDAGSAQPTPLAPTPPPDEPPPPSPPLAVEPTPGPPPSVVGSGDEASVAPLPIEKETPVVGPADALVTLVVFGDLQCEHTRSLLPELDKLRQAFPRELRIAWRHRPLAKHPHARAAAEVAQGIYADRGGQAFWAFLKAAGADRGAPTRSRLQDWLDSARVAGAPTQWIGQTRTARSVDRDMTLAGLFAIRATPTLYLNGARAEGAWSFRELETAVREELGTTRALLVTGVSRSSAYGVRVRKNLIDLGRDVPKRTCPALGGAPARGPDDALVTIVEYSDFECGYCRRLQPALEEVLTRHGGHVRVVWKNFPLPTHRGARAAAALALEAHAKKGAPSFWRGHDLLFDAQGDLGDEALSRIAGQVGLDAGAALAAVRQGRHESSIDADIAEGRRLGVTGTPTLFINGRRVPGARPAPELLALVGEEIDWAKKLVATGTPRDAVYDALCGGRSP